MQKLKAVINGTLVSLLGTPILVSSAHAQEASASQIEEVTVTAQRREETLSKVPISITAYSQVTMDRLHVQGLKDLANIVPGLVIPQASSTNNANADIAIRGIFSGGNTPTTQLYIDDTAIAIRSMRQAGPAGSFFPDIFDLERVEVLRGPQGTLFGSSAMGGAIRFITPQPSLEKSSGYAKVEVGSTETGDPSYAAGMAYGAPIKPGVAGFRVSGWVHSDGGFIDAKSPFTGESVEHDVNSSDSYSGRAALLLAPREGLTIMPAVYFQKQHTDGLASYWLRPDLGDHVTGDSPSQPNSDRVVIPSLTIKYELPGVSLQSSTSFVNRHFDTYNDTTQLLEAVRGRLILAPGLSPDFRISQNQFGGTRAWQQELRLTSSTDSRLQWVAGAYFRKAHETLTQYVTPNFDPFTLAIFGQTALQRFGVPDYVLDGQALSQLNDFNTVDQSTSAFGDVSFAFTPRLKANVGVRIEHSVVKDQQQTIAGPLTGVAFSHVDLPDQVENPITPRVALTYQYTDQDMVYASASKGYRAGGANSGRADSPNCGPSLAELGLGSAPKTFDSDSLWSYELGAKDALFDGRLSIQTSVYYISWKDIQTSIALPTCGQNFTGNRGKVVVKGAELQIEAIPAQGFKVGANVGYTDAYSPASIYGASVNGVPPLLVGEGDKLAVVLPWTAAAHAEYSWSIGGLWSGATSFVRADYRWQDGVQAGNPLVANYNAFSNAYRDPAYSTLNLRVGVEHEELELSAFVNNATRSDPALAFTNIGFRVPNYPLAYVSAIRPLTVGLTALYRF